MRQPLRFSRSSLILFFACIILLVAATKQANERIPRGAPINGVFIAHGGGGFTGEEIEILRNEGGEDLIFIPSDETGLNKDARAVLVALWSSRGFKSVTFLHASSHDEALDPEFSRPLRKGRAVFIAGGDQAVLTRYTDTPVVEALRSLLNRGGVILGTSAGMAMIGPRAILGTRKTEDGNFLVVEDAGWCFCDLIFDQHFLAKEREWRLDHMCACYPEYCGVGVDERTAAVLRFRPNGVQLSVIGKSAVCLYPRSVHKREQQVTHVKKGNPPMLVAVRP